MSGKRQATNDLNHQNWDKEEEPEERGTFRTAPEDELKARVIKKARRHVPTADAAKADDGAAKKTSIFSGFSGFSKTTASTNPTSGASPFSFLSKVPGAAATPLSFGNNSLGVTPSVQPTSIFGGTHSSGISTMNTRNTISGRSAVYCNKLESLNRAFVDFVKAKVDDKSVIVLTPIFRDYEKYLEKIDKEEKDMKTSSEKQDDDDSSEDLNDASNPQESWTKTPAVKQTSLSGSNPPGTDETKSNGVKPAGQPLSIVSFFKKHAVKADNGVPSGTVPSADFNLGKVSAAAGGGDDGGAKPSGFSFTGAKPFSFANIQPPAAPAQTEEGNEDENDEPPKVEFKQVVEEDAVYSKKCKVFVKKDNNFADRGVGTLYLKPVKDSEKTQLLVRADTNLGNILVNLILSSAIPAQRMGKNNVMMVCLPTPDAEKPTSMLLRVKTGEEADELLSKIEEYKK